MGEIETTVMESNDEEINNEVEESEEHEEVEDEETETDDSEDGSSDTEEDEEEEETDVVELGGKEYNVPKALKDAVLRQEDYTKKTMALAEERKAAEANAAQAQEYFKVQEELIQDRSKLIALDERITEFEGVDWSTFIDNDPVQAQKYQLQFTQLRAERDKVFSGLNAKGQQIATEQQANLVKAIGESEKVLARDIPNWNSELEAKLVKFAVDEYGFDADGVSKAKSDPRLYKLLNAAFTNKNAESKPVKTKKSIKPVTTIKAKSSTVNKDPSKMNDKEFAKWRRGTIKSRNYG